MASSGIAALLLPKGETAHSTMKIPIRGLDATSVCPISKRSGRADLLRVATLIIWDEAPMCHWYALEAIDRALRDLRDPALPFGGIVFVLMGDFRQVLPTIPRANRSQIIDATFKSSRIWEHFRTLGLTENMRVQQVLRNPPSDGPEPSEYGKFASWLLELGEGRLPVRPDLGDDIVQIPDEFLLLEDPMDGAPAGIDELIDFVF